MDANGAEVGDTLRLEFATNSGFTGSSTEDHVLTSDDVLSFGDPTAAQMFTTFTGFTSGATVYWKLRVVRGATLSAFSNTLNDTMAAAATASTVWTATNGVNKNQYVTVSGTPALTVSGNAGVGAHVSVRATSTAAGKRQFEVTLTSLLNTVHIGIDNGTIDFNAVLTVGGQSGNASGVSLNIFGTGGAEIHRGGAVTQTGLTTLATGDIISVEFDSVAGSMSFYRTRTGTTIQIGTTETALSFTSWNAVNGTHSNSATSMTANFGQNAFARALTATYSMYG